MYSLQHNSGMQHTEINLILVYATLTHSLHMQLCWRAKRSGPTKQGRTPTLQNPVVPRLTPLDKSGGYNWMQPHLLGMLCSRRHILKGLALQGQGTPLT